MQRNRTTSVSGLKFLEGVSAEAVAAMQSIARRYNLAEGETLFRQGESAHSFYIVVRGGVRLVEHTFEGKDVSLKVYGPDDIFGLLAVSGEFPHRAEIVAVAPSEILAFGGIETRRIMQQHSDVALRVIDLLIDHIHHAHNRIRQMAVEKTERRLARALLHFCKKFGEKCAEGQTKAHFSQQDIAEFTGTTVETVNRLFGAWQKQGYIERHRMEIVVVDTEALRHIATNKRELDMDVI